MSKKANKHLAKYMRSKIKRAKDVTIELNGAGGIISRVGLKYQVTLFLELSGVTNFDPTTGVTCTITRVMFDKTYSFKSMKKAKNKIYKHIVYNVREPIQ